jgi:alanyl-tRNA synthetase
MTERLYYHDSYLKNFTAQVVETTGDGLIAYLDRTAFYPTSGGQPFDTGSIGGSAVVDVSDEGTRIAHRLAAPLASTAVDCSIDWGRRFDHMQQHSGQHLLSAVFEELFGLRTVSFHLGQDTSTIDLEGDPVNDPQIRDAERRANQVIWENRPLSVAFEDAAQASGLRKASEREGTLRIVTIEKLDRSACGGTHVRATGEIGAILIRKLEKVRQSVRIEFLCGARAVARARNDYEALSKIGTLLSASIDNAPEMVASLSETARTADKARRKLELELATHQGRELYDATEPGPDNLRRHIRRAAGGSLDELRGLAQSFTAQSRAVFLAALENPASVLYAVSADSGLNAGQALKAALATAEGRGGGTARLAQGSLPESARLDQVIDLLLQSGRV